VWFAPTGELLGTPSFTGYPTTPQMGPEALDLVKVVENLKPGAQVVNGDLMDLNIGTSTNPAVLYAESFTEGFLNGLVLQNINGFGVLLIKGNVKFSAPFHWEGLVIVSGQATFEGGLGPSDIHGALYADQVQILSGEVTITLDTCPIASSLRTLPVVFLNWQQLL
jgi:hypothetical protein